MGGGGASEPLAQKWRSYNYSRFDEFFFLGGGGEGDGKQPRIVMNDCLCNCMSINKL